MKDELAAKRGPTITITTDGTDPIIRKFTPPESQIPPRRRLTHDELVDAVAKHRRKRIKAVPD